MKSVIVLFKFEWKHFSSQWRSTAGIGVLWLVLPDAAIKSGGVMGTEQENLSNKIAPEDVIQI